MSFALVAFLAYTVLTLVLYRQFVQQKAAVPGFRIGLIVLALSTHLLSFSTHHSMGEMVFSLGMAMSLIGFTTAFVFMLITWQRPLWSLGLLVFPLSGISSLMLLAFPPAYTLPMDVGLHISVSLLAYSVMGLATLQASLLIWQSNRLKTHPACRLLKLLPAYDYSEKAVMHLVILGFVALSLALITGVLYFDDFFAKGLAHKAVFAAIAWVFYGILIFGYFIWGWRGTTAAKITLYAYVPLLLSYLGSKMVVTFLLSH